MSRRNQINQQSPVVQRLRIEHDKWYSDFDIFRNAITYCDNQLGFELDFDKLHGFSAETNEMVIHLFITLTDEYFHWAIYCLYNEIFKKVGELQQSITRLSFIPDEKPVAEYPDVQLERTTRLAAKKQHIRVPKESSRQRFNASVPKQHEKKTKTPKEALRKRTQHLALSRDAKRLGNSFFFSDGSFEEVENSSQGGNDVVEDMSWDSVYDRMLGRI
jgi:hypothetical protein